jgi:hypothetical protein
MIMQLLVLLSFNTQAKTDADLQKLLKSSGILSQADTLPAMIKGGVQQGMGQNQQISEEKVNQAMALVDQHFSPQKLKQAIAQTLGKELNSKQITHLLAWYESDIGKEIVAAEAAAADPQVMMTVQQNAQALLADTQRVEFAKRYEALLGVTDMMMDMQVNMTTAVYAGVGALAQTKGPDLDTLKSQISGQMAMQRVNMETMMVLLLVNTFKDIDMAKLAKLEAFTSSSHGLSFSQVTLKAMVDELEQATVSWVGALIKNNQGK